MRNLISFSVISVIVTVSFALAQTGKLNNPSSEVRLSRDKPGVYITYEHSGKREPLYAHESDQGIWLRLHNNTKWKIKFPVNGVPETHGDVGMFYKLEVVSELPDEVTDIPKGKEVVHVYSPYEVRSGESVVFSVPREHLPRGIALRVRFNYEWEEDDIAGRDVEHTVSYYASQLPQLKK